MAMRLASLLRRFLRRDRGAALVEFALILPTALVIFAVMFESGRMMFAYQTAVSGVRDAARYAARAADPASVCPTLASGYWTTFATEAQTNLAQIIGRDGSLFTVQSVEVTSACPTPSVTLRETNVGVVTVTATVRIDFLFGPVLGLFGGSLSGVTARVNDQARVFGT